MVQENGLDEILTTQKIAKKLELIPKYKKYFILSNSFCIPDKLSRKDETQMQRKCDDNINKDYNAKRTLILQNQPYGGKNINMILREKLTVTEKEKIAMVVQMTKMLKSLLLNGIIPMHKMKVYHNDIKPQNLVWNKKTIKLIDWGLATVGIPESHYNIVHFNRPYESILLGLNDGANIQQIEKYIEKELKKYKENISKEPIKNDQTLFFLHPSNETTEMGSLRKYILMIAKECLKGNKFNKQYFVTNYYKKQDYWGLLYFYIDVLRILDIQSYEIKVKMMRYLI